MNKNKKHYYWSQLYFIGEDHLSKDLVENIENDLEYHEWCKEVERKMGERNKRK